MSGGSLKRHLAFIALGSNIEPEHNLPRSVRELVRLGPILAVSTVYESAPADGSDQANYLNAAILLDTRLSAERLCREALPAIEATMGRIRDPENRFAPRPIDLDLVLFDHAVLQVDHRRIPDPEIPRRPFLSVPLAELRPDWDVPGTGRTLSELADRHLGTDLLVARRDVSLNC